MHSRMRWTTPVQAIVLVTTILAIGRSASANDTNLPRSPYTVSRNDSRALRGYTLVAPMFSTSSHLIDMDGRIVHTWDCNYAPALSTYLLDNGHLLRTCALSGLGARGGRGQAQTGGASALSRTPGAGGRIQEIAWNGEIVWDFEYVTATRLPHHDITRMPNGNILMIIWDAKTPEQCIAAGRNPTYQTAELPPDGILEIKPTGRTTAEIVWQWLVWDHLIQEFDPNKPNYGKVAEHPELIDINYSESWMDPPAPGGARGGRGGGFGGGGRIPTTDWTHLNAVAYNPRLDQIIVSSYTFSEIWIIDHSTTTAEAAGHTGGRAGRGGDLLYRWGNPEAYRRGTDADQKLFCPHNAQWIEPGLQGEGHVLVFNNGPNRTPDRYSSIEELIPPVDERGRYIHEPNNTYGPKEPVWSYTDPNKTNFYATNISGAQRLSNGNTLICSGPNAKFFEVTSNKEIVWQCAMSGGTGRGRGGRGGFGGFGGTQIFRVYRYPPTYLGLTGKELTPQRSAAAER
jgi:hypothetical protein